MTTTVTEWAREEARRRSATEDEHELMVTALLDGHRHGYRAALGAVLRSCCPECLLGESNCRYCRRVASLLEAAFP